MAAPTHGRRYSCTDVPPHLPVSRWDAAGGGPVAARTRDHPASVARLEESVSGGRSMVVAPQKPAGERRTRATSRVIRELFDRLLVVAPHPDGKGFVGGWSCSQRRSVGR